MKLRSALFITSFLTGALALLPISASFAAPVFDHKDPTTTAEIKQTGAVTEILQGSKRADIFWKDFSSAAGESIIFRQPGSDAVAINRVTTKTPSMLAGLLQANGKIVIINPYGVTFTESSQTNVGSLLVTTAKTMKEKDLKTLIDRQITLNSTGGKITNKGKINAADGGFVFLIAPSLENTGTIKADKGVIALSAAKGAIVTLTTPENSNVKYEISAVDLITSGKIKQSDINNTGTLQAKSGVILLTAQAATNVKASVINLAGVTDVASFSADLTGGNVGIGSSYAGAETTSQANMAVNITGKIAADTSKTGANGGGVLINTSGALNLADTSRITSNSVGSGGNILATGGSVLSKGLVSAGSSGTGNGGAVTVRALSGNVTIGAASLLNASGKNTGFGGKVGLFAAKGMIDDSGTLTANGGLSGSGNDTHYSNVVMEAAKDINIQKTAVINTRGGFNAGEVGLLSAGGNITHSGVVNADASGTNGYGGIVNVNALGKNITINQDAIINTNGAGTNSGGTISVYSKTGAITDGGKLSANAGASGSNDLSKLGINDRNITLFAAKNVTLNSTAELSATGGADGGSMRIESTKANIVQDGKVFADAITTGNGGNVIVKAKGAITTADGAYSLKGGSNSGNGGTLIFAAGKPTGLAAQVDAADIDLTSPKGNSGNLEKPTYNKDL